MKSELSSLASLPPLEQTKINLSPEDLATAKAVLKKLETMVMDDLPSPPTPTTKQPPTEEKNLEAVSATLPPIVPTHLSEEALKEANLMADELVEALEAEPKKVESEILHNPTIEDEIASEADVRLTEIEEVRSESENEPESVQGALDQAVQDNVLGITQARKDLAASFVNLVVTKGASLAENEIIIDKALEVEPEFFEEITKTASEIADNFKLDPAGAKTAFDTLQDGGKLSAEKINDIEDGKDDTALQMLKNGLAEISKSDISDDRKTEISQKLLHHFAFVGDGQDRGVTQAAEQSLMSWARLEADPVLALTDQEKATIGEGFKNAVMATDDASLAVEPDKEEEEVETQQSPVEENEVEILQPVEEREEEEEEEEKTEIPQLAPKETGEKKEEEELKEKEVEELEEKEKEEEKEKKKKSATRVTEQSSVDLPEDEKPKKGISSKDLEDFAKASFKPAIRIGLALACAFLLPGVGPVVALGFLAVTSLEDEKKADSKKPFKANENSEVEEYLKEQDGIAKKLRAENFSKGGGVKTKVGEITAGVVSEEGKELKKTQEELRVDKDALKGVDNLQEQSVVGETKQQQSKMQEGGDVQAAIGSAVWAIRNADGDVVEGEEVVAPTTPAIQVDKVRMV